MLMFKLNIILCAVFTILFYSSRSIAYAPTEGNISSYFGPYLYKTNFSGTKSGVYSPELVGLGMIVNGDINDKGSLEIGIFQMNKVYIRDEFSKFIAEQAALTHITMGYRRWLDEYFSLSLSFYSAYSMGEPKIIYSDFPVGSEIDTSAQDTTEYGFDMAAQFELYNQPNYAIVLDARYSTSVTPKKNENADHFGLLLGFRYLYQKKVKTTPHSEEPVDQAL